MRINIPDKIITHTAASSSNHTAQDVQEWHKVRWNKYNPSPFFRANNGEPYYVGYHFIIEMNGDLVQCRALTEEGVHCMGQNFSSIGVCFMGNGDVHEPTPAQIETWKRLYARIVREYPLITPNRIYPHRKYANKSCHGKLLSDDYYIKALNVPVSNTLQLKEQVKQLQNRLLTLLLNRRMK